MDLIHRMLFWTVFGKQCSPNIIHWTISTTIDFARNSHTERRLDNLVTPVVSNTIIGTAVVQGLKQLVKAAWKRMKISSLNKNASRRAYSSTARILAMLAGELCVQSS